MSFCGGVIECTVLSQRLREGHHSNLLLAPIWNCPITSLMVLQWLLVYWDAGLLVSSLSPYLEPAAATDAEYILVPVHLIELYVSPSPTLGGGWASIAVTWFRFDFHSQRRCRFAGEWYNVPFCCTELQVLLSTRTSSISISLHKHPVSNAVIQRYS